MISDGKVKLHLDVVSLVVSDVVVCVGCCCGRSEVVSAVGRKRTMMSMDKVEWEGSDGAKGDDRDNGEREGEEGEDDEDEEEDEDDEDVADEEEDVQLPSDVEVFVIVVVRDFDLASLKLFEFFLLSSSP